MTDFLVFLLVLFVGIKTFNYGIWTIFNKKITGGLFIFLLSVSTVFLGTYILLFGSA